MISNMCIWISVMILYRVTQNPKQYIAFCSQTYALCPHLESHHATPYFTIQSTEKIITKMYVTLEGIVAKDETANSNKKQF